MKKLAKKELVFAVVIFFALIFSFGMSSIAFTKNGGTAAAQEGGQAGNVNVSLVSRAGLSLDVGSGVQFGEYGLAYKANWSDVSQMIVSFAPDPYNPPDEMFIEDKAVYEIFISVRYKQSYLDQTYDDAVVISNINLGKDAPDNHLNSLDELADYYYLFNIDTGVTGDVNGSPMNIKEWGIYQFEVTVNGQSTASAYYAIEPTGVVLSAPRIEYVESTNTSYPLYRFSIINADDYKYIDKSTLVWFVKGKTKSDTYSLLESDAENYADEFGSCNNYLFKSYGRTGTSFLFDNKNIGAEWEIWCEYKYHNSANPPLTSERKQIKTDPIFDYFNIIYIFIGVAAAVIIAVTLTSYFHRKKDRVW